jgi:hypothetical protein
MKYIDYAHAANAKGTIAFTVTLEMTQVLIDAFKKACPKVSHSVSVDWDDETMYRITFRWEPGTFGAPISTVTPSVERRNSEPKIRRGERW